MDAGAGTVLCGAAGRRAARARGRTRVATRLALRAAACLLARRSRVPPRGRPRRRRLHPLAALRRRDLLGGVRARPPHARRRTCRNGDPADGRHQRVHGADAGFRPKRARDAAHRADAVVRLSRARRQRARRLAWRRRRARLAVAHDVRGTDPARADGRLRHRNAARPQPPRLDRSVGSGGDRDDRRLSTSLLAGAQRFQPAADAAQPART